jgi:hypothetical protein
MGHMAAQPPIAVKFHRKDKPVHPGLHIDASLGGFVLRDRDDHEHHFGAPEFGRGERVFSYVASYSSEGGPEWDYDVRDKLNASFEIVEPTHGPSLTPMTRAAIANVVKHCAPKGFAFGYEKEIAVHSLLALSEANEPFPPADIKVFGATHGFSLEQAAKFSEFAHRIIEGRSLKAEGRVIKLPPGMGDKLRRLWGNHPAQ